jgi:hypothetical protein
MPQPRKTTAARLVNPLDLVILTRARLQEVVDEAVGRGRMTSGDAAELVSELIARGRSQADELFGDLEQLLARAPLEAARRVAGLGPDFPITGYDDLTAAGVVRELEGMGKADLRKVREYERANANRKSVLGAVDRKLG